MDTRTLQFIQAVIGADGARALVKAVGQSPDLEWALLPRVIMAWLGVVSHGEYEAHLPGVEETSLTFAKSEHGFSGHIDIGQDVYAFRDASLEHVAGSVAVALGVDPRLAPELRSPHFAKLGKSIDVLVRSRTLRKAREELEKTSWNAKMRRRYQFEHGADKPATTQEWGRTSRTGGSVRGGVRMVSNKPIPLDQGQVEDRRRRYAQSIGLEPKYGGGSGFPRATGNQLPFNDDFDLAHESAHAMMTPEGKPLSEYQKWLSDDSRGRAPGPSPALDEDGNEIPDEPGVFDEDELADYNEGLDHENVASHLEHHVDRRAGVDPNMFASQFRDRMQQKVDSGDGGLEDATEGLYDDKSGSKNTVDKQGRRVSRGIPNEDIREQAAGYTERFDNGAKFQPSGHVHEPTDVNAAINARAKAASNPASSWVTPAKAGFTARKLNAEYNKGELKSSGGARGIKLPGQAAAPRPPQGPIAPDLTQDKPSTAQMNNGAAGTKIVLPGMKPKKPTMKITKAESAQKCMACGDAQFEAGRYVGCPCFAELARSVKTTATAEGYRLEFGSKWDPEAIAALADNLGK